LKWRREGKLPAAGEAGEIVKRAENETRPGVGARVRITEDLGLKKVGDAENRGAARAPRWGQYEDKRHGTAD
jgi:hypothetical protein